MSAQREIFKHQCNIAGLREEFLRVMDLRPQTLFRMCQSSVSRAICRIKKKEIFFSAVRLD